MRIGEANGGHVRHSDSERQAMMAMTVDAGCWPALVAFAMVGGRRGRRFVSAELGRSNDGGVVTFTHHGVQRWAGEQGDKHADGDEAEQLSPPRFLARHESDIAPPPLWWNALHDYATGRRRALGVFRASMSVAHPGGCLTHTAPLFEVIAALNAWLHALVFARNVCAHHAP